MERANGPGTLRENGLAGKRSPCVEASATKQKPEISDWLLAAEIAATVEEVDQAGVA
jgi:hypothetical protein